MMTLNSRKFTAILSTSPRTLVPEILALTALKVPSLDLFSKQLALWEILLNGKFPFLGKWLEYLDVISSFLSFMSIEHEKQSRYY